ncbi:MAG: ATP-dependent zinc metalloprotease FtsH [Eubacteriales bacterium]|nr:ATP-dependent zinc metalloprotease FtsH [Eubacteriales bacterium]
MTVYLLLMLGILLLFTYLPGLREDSKEATIGQLTTYMQEGSVTEAVIRQNKEVPTGSIAFTVKDGTSYVTYVSDVQQAEELLQGNKIDYKLSDVPSENYFMTAILPILLGIAIVFVILGLFGRGAGGGSNQKMLDFGKSRAKMNSAKDSKVRFTDVAGLKEEKEDLAEIVDFLRSPDKYTKVGARIPKGVILVGPPGTGKTLLAKAVAGEAGVPFFSISGSDFVEMFVGVGASRVRDLFQDAKNNAPCIVFIDEIDAVGRRRGTGMGGGHDEREQTLNQLLVEMDGFGVNEGIIVMAATNRVDILDPAILRPGRFDRKVSVGRPDVQGREEILRVHAKNKPVGDDVNLTQIAQTTAGFTGADLENLMNEAAIRAAKQSRGYINQDDIKESFIKVGIGTEKKSRIISEKEKRITAYHETGHAILFHVLESMNPVYTISIIPTGPGAAGYTMPQPENDEMFMTKGKMIDHIIVDLGGRVAEEMIFDDITTGASQDIKQATETARAMITKYGMSDRLGLVNYDTEGGDEVFIGRDWGHTKSYSENVAAVIDEEVRSIIENCHKRAKELISEHTYVLEECTRQLLEKEKLSRAEFEAIFEEEAKMQNCAAETREMPELPAGDA